MDLSKIIDLPKNSDYILFNTIYHKSVNDKHEDVLTMIFKNMKTGEKLVRDIKNPQMEIYVAKPDVNLGNYNHIDIDIKDTSLVDVSYKDILRDLHKIVGKENYYWQCVKQRRFDDIKRIKEYNRFFSSDRNIEDFYRYKCLHYFGKKELNNTTKGFYDIEADISKGGIDFKTGTGTAPINAITMIDGSAKVAYTVCLRDPENPQVQALEDDLEGFKKELSEMFDEEFGKFTYNIAFFDEELDLIETLFQIINTLNLDFMLAWNQGFDMRYMMDRIEKECRRRNINKTVEDVICHPDFKHKYCKYIADTKNYEIKKKTDSFEAATYSIFLDQMINYAAIRKGKSQLDSYKLDFIGELETGSRKLNYEEQYGGIRNFMLKNYRMFIAYNIKDVLVQYKIEEKTNDIGVIFYRSYSSNTRYTKIFKEITFLTNVAFDEFKTFDGIILGNNVNAVRYNRRDENLLVDEEDDDEGGSTKKKKRFKGALVGDPLLIMNVGVLLFGNKRSSTLFRFVVDYDFTSLYPTILKMFNIYKKNLLGKIEMCGTPSNSEKRVIEENYNRGSKFIEDLECKEWSFIGERYFNLPGMTELIDIVGDELSDSEKYRKISINKIKNKEPKRKIHIKKKENECV